jgi:hypothetical protein
VAHTALALVNLAYNSRRISDFETQSFEEFAARRVADGKLQNHSSTDGADDKRSVPGEHHSDFSIRGIY